MFANKISPNTVYENSISEFYQYCKIHGYKFIFNNKRYNTNRNIFYMKLNVLLDAVIQGLKTEEYNWIFWTDSDVMIANPNIKIESFIPKDDRIHFIAASDRHGLNAGVFMLRVHPWTLDYLNRALSIAYFKKEVLRFSDQSSLNNVLVEDKEDEHYVIVPQHWFNNYPNKLKPGDFLFHFAGSRSKSKSLIELRKKVKSIENYMSSQTNESLRKEVLKYYKKQEKEKTYLKHQ
ncbi:glycosyltransferase family 34 protein [Piromyces sp. E2]|nr:glycosyltransferase family 34 protein [Piromyces sp. E2]|eukprot:OUM60962.1 glycosyltransferase family 34 protein [Piromyces sp. E2]